MSRGRPSRNCGNCRAVKRRCDQKLPHCGQCIRLREKCPGYRDEWALVFRDQTSHIIKRSRDKQNKSPPLVPTNASLPVVRLNPSIEEIGINFFLRQFVIGDYSSSRGYLNYIPPIYTADGEHATLAASMAAVGLMALANSTQQPGLAHHARSKYSEAICHVNAALSSPADSLKDSTLMSVISLGLYEHVSSFESWARHVQGAAALVMARGKGQFSSPAKIRIFSQVRADLVLSCLHGTKKFPDDMLKLQEEAAKHTDTSSSFWLLGVLGTRCTNLLMGIRNNVEEAAWSGFLEEATKIEVDLVFALQLLATEEPYTTTQSHTGHTATIYNGRFDLYKDCWSIRAWNNARGLQMVFCEILCFLLNKVLTAETKPVIGKHLQWKLQQTLTTIAKVGDDILATVPQALGLISPSSGRQPSFNISPQASMSGGYILTWGLYMVGKCAITDCSKRKWIIKCLEHIGRDAGVSIALQLLQDIRRIDEWAN